MDYTLIRLPPPDIPIRERSKRELQEYFKWFFAVMNERIRQLTAVVRDSPGFQIWRADFSPLSLEGLGDWFEGQVETRWRTQDEINKIADAQKFPVLMPISERTLTDRTLSLTFDVGMYFGEVFKRNNPTLKWEHYLRGKKSPYYGQCVLTGFGRAPLNPVWIVRTIALKVVANRSERRELVNAYEHWKRLISAEN